MIRKDDSKDTEKEEQTDTIDNRDEHQKHTIDDKDERQTDTIDSRDEHQKDTIDDNSYQTSAAIQKRNNIPKNKDAGQCTEQTRSLNIQGITKLSKGRPQHQQRNSRVSPL